MKEAISCCAIKETGLHGEERIGLLMKYLLRALNYSSASEFNYNIF